MPVSESAVQTISLTEDGRFPNNENLPLIILRGVIPMQNGRPVEQIVGLFQENGWGNSWCNGIYRFHHYHSTAHEVLGVCSGWVKALFGGPNGKIVTARTGDVIIIPAGVAHMNLGQSQDLVVVGAYPHGQMWDMNYGKPGERPEADDRIQAVPLPGADPVYGETGPLMKLWQ